MSSRLTPNLRIYRKRSGLSQREVSFLLGAKHKAKVSRYENGHHFPPLRTALAYATILDVPLPKLFPNLQRKIEKEIAERSGGAVGRPAAARGKEISRVGQEIPSATTERQAHVWA